jgi:hypothetical protein
MGLENIDNRRGSVACVLGGGGGMGGNPKNDGAKTLLPVLAEGRETSWLDGRVPNAAFLQQGDDLGNNSVPNKVEGRVEDSMGGLGREMRVSTLGDREGVCKEIRPVEKLRRVRRDSMVVGSPLIF